MFDAYIKNSILTHVCLFAYTTLDTSNTMEDYFKSSSYNINSSLKETFLMSNKTISSMLANPASFIHDVTKPPTSTTIHDADLAKKNATKQKLDKQKTSSAERLTMELKQNNNSLRVNLALDIQRIYNHYGLDGGGGIDREELHEIYGNWAEGEFEFDNEAQDNTPQYRLMHSMYEASVFCESLSLPLISLDNVLARLYDGCDMFGDARVYNFISSGLTTYASNVEMVLSFLLLGSTVEWPVVKGKWGYPGTTHAVWGLTSGFFQGSCEGLKAGMERRQLKMKASNLADVPIVSMPRMKALENMNPVAADAMKVLARCILFGPLIKKKSLADGDSDEESVTQSDDEDDLQLDFGFKEDPEIRRCLSNLNIPQILNDSARANRLELVDCPVSHFSLDRIERDGVVPAIIVAENGDKVKVSKLATVVAQLTYADVKLLAVFFKKPFLLPGIVVVSETRFPKMAKLVSMSNRVEKKIPLQKRKAGMSLKEKNIKLKKYYAEREAELESQVESLEDSVALLQKEIVIYQELPPLLPKRTFETFASETTGKGAKYGGKGNTAPQRKALYQDITAAVKSSVSSGDDDSEDSDSSNSDTGEENNMGEDSGDE